jgi:glucuronyl/N-acetylglucosaminyl transferase EXT1
MALSAVKNLMATGSRRVYKWMVALLHIISNNPAKVIAVMSTSLLLLQNMIRFFQPSMSVQPWYATNKEWHGPAKFPLCTMDVCFNFSRCDHTKELLVYHYNTIEPYWPANYFHALPSMPWYTTDPEKACLFFVFSDKDLPKGSFRPHPNTLPYWNGGLNHVIVTLADKWSLTNPPEGTIGKASILASRLHENSIRLGFDIPVPLPRLWHAPPELQSLKPFERKYFATFKGTRYLNRAGAFRSNDAFLSMHNGKDVIVATTCNQVTNNNLRKRIPKKGVGCDRDQILFDKYPFEDLFNSTFGLAPGGRSPSTFRLLEILGAGSIPVLIVDNYVKPFDNFIEWQRCLLQFPSSEIHRVLSTLRALSKEEVETRQCYCQAVFEMFLKDDATLLNTVMLAFKARFYGSLANFPLNETYLHIPSN